MSGMEWVLTAATLAAFGFGYWILLRLGRLIDQTGQKAEPVKKEKSDILVYGSSEYEKSVEQALASRDISFRRAASAREVLDCGGCKCLLALSEHETDNLIACELGTLISAIPIRIALCRPGFYEPEFDRRDIRHFAPELFPAEQLTDILEGKSRGNLA